MLECLSRVPSLRPPRLHRPCDANRRNSISAQPCDTRRISTVRRRRSSHGAAGLLMEPHTALSLCFYAISDGEPLWTLPEIARVQQRALSWYRPFGPSAPACACPAKGTGRRRAAAWPEASIERIGLPPPAPRSGARRRPGLQARLLHHLAARWRPRSLCGLADPAPAGRRHPMPKEC